MALDLSSIAFKVETKELDDAVSKLGDLQKAVSNLNKPLNASTVATEKLAQAQAKTAKANADAAAATAKAELAQARLEKTTTGNALAQAKLAKTTETTTTVTKNSTTALERQQQILEYMTQGFSKGQSSVLTYAKSTGLLSNELEELGKVLQTQRKLVGGDPFDKSTGGLESLKNKLTEAREANRLYTAGIDLTASQTKELARDKERIIEKMKLEGASLTDIKNKLKEHNAAYIAVSDAVNRLDRAEKAKIATDKATGKATDYLTREMNRAENALAGLNNEVAISSSNRLLRFKEQLIASGMATDVAAAKYQAYAKVIAETDKKRIAQQKSDEQSRINNLSRGLAPQISDVAVSLYGGMSPMTVLMQQGLQVRDLIQSSGVEAGKLNEVMRKAGADFIGTIGGTFKAIGGLAVGFFQSAGQGAVDFVTQISGADAVLKAIAKTSDGAAAGVANFSRVLSTVVGATIAASIVAFVALGFAVNQVIQEENELAKSLAKSGGSLGLNLNSALQYAEGMQSAGISTSKAITVMQEMAKTGKLLSSDIQVVTKSAIDMQTYVGVSIEDTVKSFAKLRDKPVEAIIELAKATGLVPPEIIKTLAELENQGRTAEASALAIKTLADVNSVQVNRMKEDYNGFSLFIIELGKGISDFYDNTFKSLFTKASPKAALEKQLKAIEDLISNNAGVVGMVVGGLGIGKDYYEQQKASIQEQLRLLDKASLVDQERIANNSFLASLQKDTEKMREGQLSKEQKYLSEITALQNKIAEAKQRGASADQITVMQAEITKKSLDYQEGLKKKSEKAQTTPTDVAGIAAMWEKVSSTVNKANQSYDEVVNGVQTYTNAQRVMIDLLDDQAFLKQPENLQKEALARLAVAHATELQTQEAKDLWEAEKRLILETFKSEGEINELVKAREQRGISEVTTAQNKLALLDEELADMLLQKAIYGELTVEQKKQIEYAKIQKEYKAEELRISKLLADPKNNIDADKSQELRDINYLAAAKKRQNIDQAIILENNKYEYEQRVQLAAGISESIETALFEGGQAGSKKLRDVIESELRKPITLFIQAFVQDIFGLNGTGDTMSKAVSAVDKIGSFLNGSTLTDAIGGSFNKFALSETGQKLGLSNMGGEAPGLTNLGVNVGKYAGMAGNALAGYGISKTLSGGYKTGLGGVVDTIGGIASAIPGVGPIAGLISGAVNRAFGRKLTETGVEGTFGGAQGFTGNQYSFEKGGWFRSDRTKTSALDTGIQEGFANQFNTLRAGIAVMSTSLGLGTKSIEDFTYSFKLNLMGLSEVDATKKIKEEFDKASVAIADTIPELKEYTKVGETNLDVLSRLSSALSGVNSMFGVLGFSMQELTLSGANSANSIAEAYGGLESFNTVFGQYYEEFYSEEEKRIGVIKEVNASLMEAGLTIDVANETRASYRALIEELMQTKGATDPTVVALISASSAFASIQDPASDAEEAIDKVAESMKTLGSKTKSLQVQYLEAIGDTTGAKSLQRSFDIEGMTSGEIAIYDYNASFETLIENIKKGKTATDDYSKAQEQAVKDQFDTQKSNLSKQFDDQKSSLSIQLESQKESLSRLLDSQLKAVDEVLAAQLKAYDIQIEAAKKQADIYADIRSKLQSAFDSLRVEIASAKKSDYFKSSALVSSATKTGVLTPGLEDALQVISEDTKNYFSTAADYAFARTVDRNNVGNLLGQADALSADAEAQIAKLEELKEQAIRDAEMQKEDYQLQHEEHLRKLDSQHEETLTWYERQYQAQIAQIEATYELAAAQRAAAASNQSAINQSAANQQNAMVAAIGQLATQMNITYSQAESVMNGSTSPSQYVTNSTGAVGNSTYVGIGTAPIGSPQDLLNQAAYNAGNTFETTYNPNGGYSLDKTLQGYKDMFPAGSFGSNYTVSGFQSFLNAVGYKDVYSQAATSALQLWGSSKGLPAYAVGTNLVSNDQLAYIHKDEAVVPADMNPFNPAARTPFISQDNSELKEEISMLRAELRANVIQTSKLQNNIDRLIVPTAQGYALSTKAVA